MNEHEARDKIEAMFPDGRVYVLPNGHGSVSMTFARMTAHLEFTVLESGVRIGQIAVTGLGHVLPYGKVADLTVKLTQGQGWTVDGSGAKTTVTALF